ADLPVFISSDMVLEALYRSHDKILQPIEKEALRPRLERLLLAMRSALAAEQETSSPEAASALNLYFGVPLTLVDRGSVDGREPPGVAEFVNAAVEADGEQERTLFGVSRRVDFSQFKPRGHYAGDPELESYFRAMIWLGRIDLRLIETQSDGSQVLRRRQVEAMVGMRRLLDDAALSDYLAIDRTLTLFVGEHDYMTLQDVDRLLSTLDRPKDLEDMRDSELAAALVGG